MAIKLNHSSLELLPTNVAIPNYDINTIRPGIVHIGVGNFHRAHQAVYLDRLFNLGLDHDWGVVGAGVMPGDAAMRQKLQSQDWLTTVVDLDEKGLTARVSGAMIDFIDTKPSSIIDVLVRPEIRIVSLTITEGGYFIDEETGGFYADHTDIQYDIKHPDTPRTVFGILAAGLEKRRVGGIKPFTIMSCDNAPSNGNLTKQTLLGLADSINSKLGKWIDEEVAFPNSMVDCITPITSRRQQEKLLELFDIDDAAPVFCEPFRQWVLEDKFPQGRPALEKVGVEFVSDIAPYELMKLRILNGGHAAIAFPAALMGFHYVHDAMNEPILRGYLEKLIINEVIPTLPTVPGVDFNEYFALIIERFSNPEIGDTIPRLCVDSSNRLPKFILPIIAGKLDSHQSIPGLALVIALWCLFCAAAGEPQNSDITLIDQHSERLERQALLAQDRPSAFLEMDDIFGALGRHPTFVMQFTRALKSIARDGINLTLENYGK